MVQKISKVLDAMNVTADTQKFMQKYIATPDKCTCLGSCTCTSKDPKVGLTDVRDMVAKMEPAKHPRETPATSESKIEAYIKAIEEADLAKPFSKKIKDNLKDYEKNKHKIPDSVKKMHGKADEEAISEISKDLAYNYTNTAKPQADVLRTLAAKNGANNPNKLTQDKRKTGLDMAGKKINGLAKVNATEETVDEAHTVAQLKNAITKHSDKVIAHNSESLEHLRKAAKAAENNDWKAESEADTMADGHDRAARRHDIASNKARELLDRVRQREHLRNPHPIAIHRPTPKKRFIAKEEVEQLAEGERLISKHVSANGKHHARVVYNHDLGEFKAKVYPNGKHHEPADYFTDNKEDAQGTAKAMLAHAEKHAG